MIKPLYDKILIEPEVIEKTASGIILTQTEKEKPEKGRILAIGEGRMLQDGSLRPLGVAVGDLVFFRRYAADVIEQDNKKLYFIIESDIVAILTE